MKILTALLLCLFLASCNHKVIVTFEQETPDIVPSDEGFYHDYHSVCIKSSNQNVVYSANELTSRINIVINTIERTFQKQRYALLKENENPDLLIELIAVDPYDYHTNKAVKSNGKKKKLPCDYTAVGANVFVKITNRDRQVVNYTFHFTPCTDGCSINYKAYCERLNVRQSRKGRRKKVVDVYEGKVRKDAFDSEALGQKIALFILHQMTEKAH